MPETPKKSRRVVAARRTLAVGTIAATALGTTAISAGMAAEDSNLSHWTKLAQVESEAVPSGEGGGEGEGEAAAADSCLPASGEGEGEGEGEGTAAASGEGEGEGEAAASGGGEGEAEGGAVTLDPAVCLSRDLGFMEGHLRAGLTLYEAGDLEAAQTHMGHPIEEKYDAVAEPLAERGYGRLEQQLKELAAAAEAGSSLEEIQPLYDSVVDTIEEARDELPPESQLLALALLTRIAADEYTVAVEGGTVSNLHEYQDSWGFLRVVETESGELAESDDAEVSEAASRIKEHLSAVDAAYGDIQGQGDFEMDPSLIYGAAARMELAALGLK